MNFTDKLRKTLKSWTTWAANLTGAAVAVATALQDQLPVLKEVLTPTTYACIAVATGLAVAILRVRKE